MARRPLLELRIRSRTERDLKAVLHPQPPPASENEGNFSIHDVKNLAAMKNNSIHRSQSSSSFKKTGSISGIGSTSKDPEPTKRVFWG
ncbi:hypothetical protein JHK86_049753 [Glycine max]|nr:hypothetical protein JHK86_049753 [Glycine max]